MWGYCVVQPHRYYEEQNTERIEVRQSDAPLDPMIAVAATACRSLGEKSFLHIVMIIADTRLYRLCYMTRTDTGVFNQGH